MPWWRFPDKAEREYMKKNSIKNTRINMEVQRELSEIIRREIKDPRIHPMTTVVAVEVTPDLKYCKAYIRERRKRQGIPSPA